MLSNFQWLTLTLTLIVEKVAQNVLIFKIQPAVKKSPNLVTLIAFDILYRSFFFSRKLLTNYFFLTLTNSSTLSSLARKQGARSGPR
jgi:hypothetical protein